MDNINSIEEARLDIKNNLDEVMDEFDDEQLLFRQFQAGKLMGQVMGFLTFGVGNGLLDKNNIALSDSIKGEFFTGVELFSKDRADGHFLTFFSDALDVTSQA